MKADDSINNQEKGNEKSVVGIGCAQRERAGVWAGKSAMLKRERRDFSLPGWQVRLQ
jgi:hypothetical protein